MCSQYKIQIAITVVIPDLRGIGLRILNEVCRYYVTGASRYGTRPRAVYFHTSHADLCAPLRRLRGWAQCSSVLFGGDKTKSARSIIKSLGTAAGSSGYGGHFRAVQGFKFTNTPTPA